MMGVGLEREFHDLVRRTGSPEALSPSTVNKWWERIIQAYGEKGRYYHTLEHVSSMWNAWARMSNPKNAHDDACVKFAIIFHDIVYKPTAPHGENELLSVSVWQEFAEEVILDNSIVNDVKCLIEATIEHKLPKGEYPSFLAHFLDLDLEVLGRNREEYAMYAQAIREEYRHYPDDEYRKGRADVLKQLSEGYVYFTEEWRSSCASLAKENLAWEIEQLESMFRFHDDGAYPKFSKIGASA